MMLDKIRLASH